MEKLSMRAVVLSISLLIMSPMAVSPAVADIIAAFPTVSPITTMWVVTMPSITMVIFSLVYGGLVKFLSKRTLIAIAMACFLVGGITPAFMGNIYMILAMRALFGAGIGFLMPLSTGLITDFYDGPDRASMMGWQSAAVNFGGLAFMFTGGILAAIHWNYTFLAYSIGIFVAAWIFIKLPEPERSDPEATEKARVPRSVFPLIAGVFLFNILFFALMTNASVMISGEGLGETAQAGIVLTMFSVGGFFAGIAFGKTAKIFGALTNAAGWLATGAGMTVIAASHSIPLIAAGSFIAGMGMATVMPSYLIKIAVKTPAPAIAMAYAGIFGQEFVRFP
jgi:MFS family permease